MEVHHLFWPRATWTGVAKPLRNHWYTKVEVSEELHRALHVIDSVPVPRPIAIHTVMSQLAFLEKYGGISKTDSIEKRLKVLGALLDLSDPGTHAALATQLKIVHSINPRV